MVAFGLEKICLSCVMVSEVDSYLRVKCVLGCFADSPCSRAADDQDQETEVVVGSIQEIAGGP